MPVSTTGGQLVSLLVTIGIVLQGGLILSGIGLVSHKLTDWLSRHTRIESPDPTMYIRQFEVFFERLFTPIGQTAANKTSSPLASQLSFYFSIGITVIAIATAIYVMSAGLITGTAMVTYQTLGIVFDPVPLFRQIVALVVIGASAILLHAWERSGEVAT